MSEYGDISFDDRWYDEPLEKYLDYKKDVDGVTDARFWQIHRAIKQSPESADYQALDEFAEWRREMTIEDARAFLKQLRDAGLADSVVKEQMVSASAFLGELLKRDVINSNPLAYVLDETDFKEGEDNGKLDRSITEVGSYLASIPNIQSRAMGVLFAKTGIRCGENHNIDLPFIHLDHDIFHQIIEEHDIALENEVADNPDTLYIPSEPTIGEMFRGEKRQRGNKRKRGTLIPIDSETKKALLDWLAIRPVTEHPHPLWVKKDARNTRTSETHASNELTNYWAEETGFVEDGDTSEFTPHWFRHFFTTNMKPGRGHHDDSIAPSLVKYIRGDVEDDIMEVYTHDWGDQVREQYLDAIYQFGIYD